MRKTNFLYKLFQERKLHLVEPNETIAKAYVEKSCKSLSSAKALLKIGNMEDSVSMAYYAMYHYLLALLFRAGIKCENHTAAIILLKEVFEIDNTSIAKAKAERIDKQYYIDFKASEKDTEEAIQIAEEFAAMLKAFIDKLNNDFIKRYHERAIQKITNNERALTDDDFDSLYEAEKDLKAGKTKRM